jgi:hypothetical protein
MEQPSKEQQAIATIQKIVTSPAIPRFYANGFMTAKTATDAFIVAQVNGAALFIMNVSFMSLKNLHVSLGKMIEEVEKETGEIKPLKMGQ